MKRIVLTGLILFAVVIVCRAQSITFHKQGITLKQLFDEIRKQTGYDFLYNPQILAKAKPINVEAMNSPLKKVLDDCFASQPLTYVIDEKTIIVKEKPAGGSVSLPAITGRLINKESKSPIEGASIFLSNGTVGTSSGADGAFAMRNIRAGNYDLVVSMLGFETWRQGIQVTTDDITLKDIEISPKSVGLKEVVVKARDDRNRNLYYSVFKRAFLGTSGLADQCSILNPEVLDYDYNNETHLLSVASSDFLVIQNNALGYRIKYLLTGFSCNLGSENVSYDGSVLFEKLPGPASQLHTWANKRRQVYEASQMHFLRALLNDQLDEEGFRVLKIARSEKKINLVHKPLHRNDILCKTDKPGVYAICHDTSDLYFEYSRNRHFHENARYATITSTANLGASVIFFSSPYLLFDQNGWVLNPKELSSLGVWERYRVAGLLPADYQPFETDSASYVATVPDTTNTGKQLLAMKDRSDSAINKFPAEKIYLQTDKPDYMVGDTIWMKAWLLNAPTLLLSSRSGLLHIDIADERNNLIKQYLLQVTNGLASGQVSLDDKVFKDGNYTIRAYTNWMRNFGSETFFYKRIRVASTDEHNWLVNSRITQKRDSSVSVKAAVQLTAADKVPLNDSLLQVRILTGSKSFFSQNIKTDKNGLLDFQFKIPAKEKLSGIEVQNPAHSRKVVIPVNSGDDIDLQFMPESGNLVAGLPARIGFKAIGEDGRGVDISGVIVNREGKQCTTFKSSHNGMGRFELTPEPGEVYRARVTLPDGLSKSYPLPQLKSSGMVLRANENASDESIGLSVMATEDLFRAGGSYFLIGKARGVICYAAVVDLGKGALVKRQIAASLFPTGITHFMLTTTANQPVCERLVYVNHHDELRVGIGADQPVYAAKDSIALHLKVTDAAGQPVAGNFSLAVTDNAQTHADTSNTILSSMLLTSDLRGFVEDPDYYLRNDTAARRSLDNLLLTQGWVNYDSPSTSMPYPAETEFAVTGRVNNVFNSAVKKTDVLLLSNRPPILMDTVTNEQGLFKFDHFPKVDSPVFVVQARNRHGRSFNVNVSVDEVVPPLFSAPAMPRLIPWYVNTDTTLSHFLNSNIRVQQQYYKATGHLLSEVKITAKKTVAGSYNLNGSGNADQVIDEKELGQAGKKNILQLFFEKIKGFHEGSRWVLVHHLFGASSQNGLTGDAPTRFFEEWYYVSFRRARFFFDGIEIDSLIHQTPGRPPVYDIKEFLESHNAEDIKGIEVNFSPKYIAVYDRIFDPPGAVPGEAVFIEVTTRSGHSAAIKNTPGVYLYKPLPLTLPKQFYRPRYLARDTSDTLDLRSTIHWEPNITTDAQGEATVSFYTGSEDANYRIIVQGTDGDGFLGFGTRKITVEKRKKINQ